MKRSHSSLLRRLAGFFPLLLIALAIVEPAFAGKTGGAEFKAATDDITAAAGGYGGFLISLLGGVVGLLAGIAMGKVTNALSGLLWAFIPGIVFGVIAAKYSGLV